MIKAEKEVRKKEVDKADSTELTCASIKYQTQRLESGLYLTTVVKEVS